jgi:DNA-binding IclR family transcriptional regulator
MDQLTDVSVARVQHISNNNKEKFERTIASMVREGWVVREQSQKYGSYFATLVKGQ